MSEIKSISTLIQKYELGSYYNIGESQLRKFVLDDFLSLLGWDMSNEQMLPFYKQEVVVEENLKGKFPDYSLRNTSKETIGNPSLYFFVEVKEARQTFRGNLNFPIVLIKKLTIPPASMEKQGEIALWVRKKLTDLWDDYYKLKEGWSDGKLKEEETRLMRVEYELHKQICDLYVIHCENN